MFNISSRSSSSSSSSGGGISRSASAWTPRASAGRSSAKPRRATNEGQWVLRTPLHIRTIVFLPSAWF